MVLNFNCKSITPITGGGSAAPITNYNDLTNKPSINGVVLSGDKNIAELGIITGMGGYGIKADYCTKYGIIDCPNGLIEYEALSNDVVVKAGMQLIIPNKETKTQIGSDITYTIESIVDVTLFYAEGTILEAERVYYQTEEPPEDGILYTAWWNPETKMWCFRSNDTGNVWREASATPIADVHFIDENIVRIDYVGYRHLNSEIFAPNEELLHNRAEIEEIAEELGAVSNAKQNRYDGSLTTNAKTIVEAINEINERLQALTQRFNEFLGE